MREEGKQIKLGGEGKKRERKPERNKEGSKERKSGSAGAA